MAHTKYDLGTWFFCVCVYLPVPCHKLVTRIHRATLEHDKKDGTEQKTRMKCLYGGMDVCSRKSIRLMKDGKNA